MSEESVNVESRTSSQDKRWTIMAALLGTNTALMLFQGIEQSKDYVMIREVALAIIAAALPFQAIYFLIYTFVLEHEQRLPAERLRKLELASALCQVVSYGSLVGVRRLRGLSDLSFEGPRGRVRGRRVLPRVLELGLHGPHFVLRGI